MDYETILVSLVSSGVIGVGTGRWLVQRFIDHRLTKELKEVQQRLDNDLAVTKSGLDTRLASVRANLEASLKREVEEYLGDRSADRQYRLDARKRLYAAISPLRFQLIVATRDFANRVSRIGTGHQPFPVNLRGYFGRSTIFRLLRLFGIVELIERQMAYEDFTADPSTAALLRFKLKAFLCLSSSSVALDHPNVNWNEQYEHVFFDALSLVAAATVVNETEGRQRVMRFDEFNTMVSDPTQIGRIDPIPHLLDGFVIPSKPILWLRLVALGALSAQFLRREGPPAGLDPEPFDVERLVEATLDEFITANRSRYVDAIRHAAEYERPTPPI